jgi:hypothetical protein
VPTHLDEMASRLPVLYRDGDLARGWLGQAAVQLEIGEEEGREIQRSHWFDATLELDEAVRLAAPLGIPLEEWQTVLAEYRAWVHAMRDARLQDGAVTVSALERFVVDYATAFGRAVHVDALPDKPVWGDRTARGELVFAETPPARRYDSPGPLEPLLRFSVTQRGLDETRLACLFVGLPDGPESVPVLANLTTGQALVYQGDVPPGARLWLRPTADGHVTATLEGQDVTDRLRSVDDLEPGTPWTSEATPASAITLARGENQLWFLPVAHYDALGLDRFLLALADLRLTEGRWDSATFDNALFYVQPAARLFLSWVETQPATFEIRLPGGSFRSPAGQLDDSLAERDRLGLSLDRAIQQLRASGVRGSARLEPFGEVQPLGDLVRIVGVQRLREIGPTGADRLPDTGGVFEVTPYDGSTFR